MEVAPGGFAQVRVTANVNQALGSWKVVGTVETTNARMPERTYELTYATYPHNRFVDSVIAIDTGTQEPQSTILAN